MSWREEAERLVDVWWWTPFDQGKDDEVKFKQKMADQAEQALEAAYERGKKAGLDEAIKSISGSRMACRSSKDAHAIMDLVKAILIQGLSEGPLFQGRNKPSERDD